MHWLYAISKIGLAVVGLALWVWFWQSFYVGVGLGPGMTWEMLIPAAMTAMVGCVYPVALLIALRRPSVRSYFGRSDG